MGSAAVIPFGRPEPDTMEIRPIFVARVGVASVRYFLPASEEPILPWVPVEDIGRALGLDDDGVVQLTLRVVRRWAPWLKAVDAEDGKKVILPLLGVTALCIQTEGGVEIEPELMEGAALAMEKSLANATPSERFQAMILAARSASSPGEYNSLLDLTA